MIKAIIFDCFGVLTTDTWREFCSSIESFEVLKQARELNHEYDSGKLSLQEFLAKVQDLTGSQPTLVESLPDGSALKNAELLKLISSLKSKYKIGLLSNIASNWIRDSFLSETEQNLFDEMVFSYEVGITKPDERIFELICERLGVELEEAIMIDDIESYCESAKSIGMKSVVYHNFVQMKKELDQILDD